MTDSDKILETKLKYWLARSASYLDVWLFIDNISKEEDFKRSEYYISAYGPLRNFVRIGRFLGENNKPLESL